MLNIIDVYVSKLNNFINSKVNEKTNAILFFQGFPTEFYRAISTIGVKHFSNCAFSNYIDYRMIDPSTMLSGFLSATGLCWGFYEELVCLTQVLNDFGIYKGKIFVVNNNLFSEYFPIPVPIEPSIAVKYFENDDTDSSDDTIGTYYSDIKMIGHKAFYSYVNKHYDIDVNTQIIEVDFFIQEADENTEYSQMTDKIIQVHDLPLLTVELIEGKLTSNHYTIQCFNDDLSTQVAILNSIGKKINILFEIKNISRSIAESDSGKHLNLLKKYWGTDAAFRERKFYKDPASDSETIGVSQGALVSDVIRQCECALNGGDTSYSDLIITAPTGAGKSLFFQIPAIYLHQKYKAVTLVICPLVALMNDQVKELEERGIWFSTFINSEISYETRRDRLDGIMSGKYSIVYLSPELLLSYDIKNIIGDRTIGLIVVDEAHLVTSWGRDFRVDYWFLGDYLEKARRGNYYRKTVVATNFPILCLTATAVFGGRDDVIEDLQKSLKLNCSSEHLYIGYVVRDNIRFEINHPRIESKSSHKSEDIRFTVERVKSFIERNEKTIVYFPYVSQIDDVKNQLEDQNADIQGTVEKYSGSGMRSLEKNESYNRFRDSEAIIMLATKAFGMGVNIPDVQNVYHFAPTGTLADYVQEIGRAARQLLSGNAITDFLPNDMSYAKTLWGLSGLRHYQIKAIMKKLYDLYKTKGSRNLLISPDAYSFLFDANSVDMKVKSGLMLLSSDLLDKFHFRVITVRPKNIFTHQYIVVPKEVEKLFMDEYGQYCVEMTDDRPRVTPSYGNNSCITTINNGTVYEIDLGKVWENEFNDLTFAQFKHHFFAGELFAFGDANISPKIKLIINFDKGYENARDQLLQIASALQKTFNSIYTKYGGKNFTFSDFSELFNKYLDKKTRREYLLMLLDVFCYEKTDIYDIPNEQWKFIERRKGDDSGKFGDKEFCIRSNKHGFIENNLKRYLKQVFPNSIDCMQFITYLSIPKKNGKYDECQLVASLLELFDFATYDLIGGRNPQIFVRINDPMKLKRISESEKEYRNGILTNIEDRHKRAVMIMNKFMMSELNDTTRWEIIENYFLGYDGIVDSMLGIES